MSTATATAATTVTAPTTAAIHHRPQIRPFDFEGVTFHSCEQAYQAYKYAAGSLGRARVCAVTPSPDDDAESYGHRVWEAGNSQGCSEGYSSAADGSDKIRDDWDQLKVSPNPARLTLLALFGPAPFYPT